jgi:hypothetical protein
VNSKAGLAIMLALFTGILSGTQAWVLKGARPRFLRYAAAWIVCTVVIGFAGRYFLWGTQPDRTGLGDMSVRVSAAIISALGLMVGAWRVKDPEPEQSWRHVATELMGPHFAVVFFGSTIALVVIIFVLLGNANW